MSQQVVAARVDNGTVILLHEHGGEVNRFGSTYAVAGVSGDDLIVVSESGGVDLYKIEGGTRAVYSKGLGKTSDPVSIQVAPGLNFSIQKSNGQTDVYAAGHKVRTTGTAQVEQPTSCSSEEDTSSYYSDDESSSYYGGSSGGYSYDDGERFPMLHNFLAKVFMGFAYVMITYLVVMFVWKVVLS